MTRGYVLGTRLKHPCVPVPSLAIRASNGKTTLRNRLACEVTGSVGGAKVAGWFGPGSYPRRPIGKGTHLADSLAESLPKRALWVGTVHQEAM